MFWILYIINSFIQTIQRNKIYTLSKVYTSNYAKCVTIVVFYAVAEMQVFKWLLHALKM